MPSTIRRLLRQAITFRRSPVRLSSIPRILLRRGARKLAERRPPADGLDQALAEAGLGFDDFLERSFRRDRQFVALSDDDLEALRELDPERVERTVADAERVLAHEFRLLGSGPYRPRDPERPERPSGYQPIDWYLDPVSELRFPEGVPHTEWDLYAMRPGLADIKLPWELARCQHWATLGQAWRLARDPRFALEIVRQREDFDEANPPGIGIHWTCTMDAALRALSWTMALALVRDCEALDAEAWRGAYRSLFDHGRFIRANLENTYEVTSNHYLSNVIGLYALGKAFGELEEGRDWEAYAFRSIVEEMGIQVLDDGADFESSVPYHRLVTELFLSAARLAEVTETPFPAAHLERLRDMVEFFAAVVRPDGLMPQLGDADDGRAHILTDYGSWNPQDGRHLLGAAAAFFDRPEWSAAAGEDGRWEAAWWGFGVRPVAGDAAAGDGARLFPDAGLAVARRGGEMLLVTNGVVGTRGFGNHKHNDQLSFEYHHRGRAIVVDPGSYVYTSDPEARNLFRSTGYHNTLEIDGEEQNETNPEWLFRLFETAKAEHLEFRAETDIVTYRGRHVGYERLAPGVVHERTFRYRPETGLLAILDRLSGAGSHRLRWHFHLDPEVAVERTEGPRALLASDDLQLALRAPDALRFESSPAWYSPSYGVRRRCLALDAEIEATVGEPPTAWLFLLGPRAAVEAFDANRAAALEKELLAERERPS